MDEEKNERQEKIRREEDQNRRRSKKSRVKRKKAQAREMLGKLQNTMFFQGFVAPQGQR